MALRKFDIGALIGLLIALIGAAVWLGRLEGRVLKHRTIFIRNIKY